MPTVAEVLKQSGFDDAAIAAFDQRAMTAFGTVLSQAEQARIAGETAQRAATELFETEINPALNAWGTKEAVISAERDYYKTLAMKAKDGGFIAEVPEFKAPGQQPGQQPGFDPNQPRNPQGQWQQTPGSPDVRQLENQVGNAMGVMADLQWKYQTLFGTPMPDSPTTLAAEAAKQRLSLPDYAARKYEFEAKEKAIREAKQKEHDDKIRADATAERDKYYAERMGGNPNLRQAEPSRFAELQKGVTDGTRQDPVKMTPEQRRAATRSGIAADRAAAAA